jgi:hypothetical protein
VAAYLTKWPPRAIPVGSGQCRTILIMEVTYLCYAHNDPEIRCTNTAGWGSHYAKSAYCIEHQPPPHFPVGLGDRRCGCGPWLEKWPDEWPKSWNWAKDWYLAGVELVPGSDHRLVPIDSR